jgi:hypothetical protein
MRPAQLLHRGVTKKKESFLMIPDELIKAWPTVAGLMLTGIGTVIGYILKDYLDKRKDAEAKRVADRRDHYRNVILCLKSLSEGKRDNDELLRFEYPFLWLYAPDTVIHSFNRLLCRLSADRSELELSSEVADLILAMRRDLGFKRTRLLTSDFKPSKLESGPTTSVVHSV